MPYVNKKRPYKKEYKQQKSRGEHANRMKRQKARRDYDKRGVNRKGKDIDHKKPLSKGGSNKRKNLRLVSKKANRSKKDKT
jgi:5-methylcytosine-specific restriction endonuclease McrA